MESVVCVHVIRLSDKRMKEDRNTHPLSSRRTVFCDAVSTELIRTLLVLNICSGLSEGRGGEGRGLSHDADDGGSTMWFHSKLLEFRGDEEENLEKGFRKMPRKHAV